MTLNHPRILKLTLKWKLPIHLMTVTTMLSILKMEIQQSMKPFGSLFGILTNEPPFCRDELDFHQTTASSVSNETLANGTHSYLTLVKHLSNLTREAGDTVRFRCEFNGQPLPKVVWYKNEAPIEPEKGKIIVKNSRTSARDPVDRVRSRLIINRLETHDIGFYKCEATNGFKTVESIGVLQVKAGTYRRFS